MTTETDPPICDRCNGSGEGMADGTTCSACRGHGVAIDRQSEEDRAAAYADHLYDQAKDERAEREGMKP
jgi:DnaJ-class molecular chaperone